MESMKPKIIAVAVLFVCLAFGAYKLFDAAKLPVDETGPITVPLRRIVEARRADDIATPSPNHTPHPSGLEISRKLRQSDKKGVEPPNEEGVTSRDYEDVP